MNRSGKVLQGDGLIGGRKADNAAARVEDGSLPPWRVLIVSAVEDVHTATVAALRGAAVAGRTLEFLHARSADEARRIMETAPGIAVILLDIVLETGDAGLRLARAIRDELGCNDTRIILRSVESGHAPALDVVRDHDFDDCRSGPELAGARLAISLTTAIRTYAQLHSILEENRKLDHVAHSMPGLFARRSLEEFAEGALRQTASLIEVEPHGVFCVSRSFGAESGGDDSYYVVAGQGKHLDETGRAMEDLGDRRLAGLLERCILARRNLYEEGCIALYFAASGRFLAALCLEMTRPPGGTDRRLLEILGASMAVGLDNITLFQRLNFFAYFDPLCRLPNRAYFVSFIDQRLRQDERGWTVALLDIDHFFDINAALGHQTGDLLLVAVAGRLRAGLPAEVTVARVSGGTFGLLGPGEALDPEKILAQFEDPIVVDDQSLMIQPYMGLECLAEAEGSGMDIFKNANIALGRARSERRGRWQYFTRDMRDATRQRLELLHDLRHATDDKRGLSLYYQPLVEVAGGRVVGAEALMRWKNERGEEVPPHRFIPLAEYSHLIIELGEWALRTACGQLMEWERAGHRGLRMSVNVSIAQFRAANFVAMVRRCIGDSGVDPMKIELEITESMALTESEAVLEALYDLKDLGLSLAIDDFGTGFSSLNHLHRLPFDRLKIDRSFVADLYAGGSGASIAEMIIRLGRMSGMSVIAEGVETTAQLEMLRALGCDEAQGLLFSGPVPAERFAQLLGPQGGG